MKKEENMQENENIENNTPQAEATNEASASDKKDKKKKKYVNPFIAFGLIAITAAVVLCVGLYIAKTLA